MVASDTATRIVADSAGIGMDKVLVTAASSTSDPLLLATEVARDRGAVVLVGAVPIDLPRAPLYGKELSFRVSRSYGPGRYDSEYEERGLDYPIGYVRWTEQRNMACFLDLLASGAVLVDDLVDEVVSVDDAARAYARLTGPAEARPKGALVIEYGEPAAHEIRASPARDANHRPVRPHDAVDDRPGIDRARELRLQGDRARVQRSRGAPRSRGRRKRTIGRGGPRDGGFVRMAASARRRDHR